MKPQKLSRHRRAWPGVLLLLTLTLGGWGWLVTVSPDKVPSWLRGLRETLASLPFGTASGDANGDLNDTSGSGAGATAGDLVPGASGRDGTAGSLPLDPKALPIGLTSIDGESGTGVDRAVKKNGVWFPVYSPGLHLDSGNPPLTRIPLSIASGNPTAVRVDQTLLHQAEAIGGSPPYRWSAVMNDPAHSFTFGTTDGLLTGTSSTPLKLRIDVTVVDAAGALDSASWNVVVLPENELSIEEPSWDPWVPGVFSANQLTVTGGVPPYEWAMQGKLPQGLEWNGKEGSITGSTETAGEFPLNITVIDAQQSSVTRTIRLLCRDSLEIINPSALPPAPPGQPWHLALEAAGGLPPYQWMLTGGQLPGPGWELSMEGVLTGNPVSEAWAEFAITLEDSEGTQFEKWFRLVVSDLLIAVPSREKAGLAWQPEALQILAGMNGNQVTGAQLLRNGQLIYEGSGNSWVDRGLASGSTVEYTLQVLTGDGSVQPVASRRITILPQSLNRAVAGKTGDPFADRVLRFQPLSAGGYGHANLPDNVTGPPDGRSTYAPAYRPTEVLSLHARNGAGGLIELEFTDNIVEMAPGEDLTIFENVLFVGGMANQRFMEPAVVSVALFPGQWHPLPCDVVPPAAGQPLNLMDPFYYSSGFAGRNGTTGGDPTNPARSGGDSLDLGVIAARTGLAWIRYLRIQSTGDNARNDDVGSDPIRHPQDPAFSPLTGTGSSGFDLDAVSAVHY